MRSRRPLLRHSRAHSADRRGLDEPRAESSRARSIGDYASAPLRHHASCVSRGPSRVVRRQIPRRSGSSPRVGWRPSRDAAAGGRGRAVACCAGQNPRRRSRTRHGERHSSRHGARRRPQSGCSTRRSLFSPQPLGRGAARSRRGCPRRPKFDSVRTALRDRSMDHLARAWNLLFQRTHRLLPHSRALGAMVMKCSSRRSRSLGAGSGEGSIRERTRHHDLGNMWFHAAGIARRRARTRVPWLPGRRAVEKLPTTFVNEPERAAHQPRAGARRDGRPAGAREEAIAVWKDYADRNGDEFRLCSFPAWFARIVARVGRHGERRALVPARAPALRAETTAVSARRHDRPVKAWRCSSTGADGLGVVRDRHRSRLRRQVSRKRPPLTPTRCKPPTGAT